MRVVELPRGFALHGEFPSDEVLAFVQKTAGPLPLVLADPPYGNIVNEEWDETDKTDVGFCEEMIGWTQAIEALSLPGAALYVWGGVGKPRHEGAPPFRPFLRYLVEVELQTGYNLATPVTWKKRRGYGIQWSYLFTREELAYLVLGDVKKPRRFKVPLLDRERGYAGYDPEHPAKSEFLRRTNVWDDVTEILSGKLHVNQKPERLFQIPIEAHTEPGEWVLDPFGGSGTTAKAALTLGRRYIVVERDPREFGKMVEGIRAHAAQTSAPLGLFGE